MRDVLDPEEATRGHSSVEEDTQHGFEKGAVREWCILSHSVRHCMFPCPKVLSILGTPGSPGGSN